ncbi:DUF6233 domain-containing protein [Streptomyces huasconensis]|uniref:DUF6233 domain-containing protein n=1 Tax=Streptomyces huasconensis TaxID=1854574 RepID=UPI0036F9C573
MTDPALPPQIRAHLPDGQELTGRLHARQETIHGWMYWTGLALWQYSESTGVEPAEYRVWLSTDHVQPLPGQTYDSVPTHRLPQHIPAPDTRWAWTVQQIRGPGGCVTGTAIHDYDCLHSPRGEALNLDQALTALRRPGARACKDCDAAIVLTPLV